MRQSILFLVFLCSFFIGFGQCPTTPIELTSQADIDDFSINFPDCTEILNGLIISGDDIVDLSPLNTLSSISEELTIINNPQLTSIEGFDAVDFIEMILTIENNSALLSMQGLSDTAVDGNEAVYEFIVKNNPSLLNLEGLNLLSSNAVQIVVENNDSLIDLSGLSINTNINNFVIADNQNLINLSGIDILFDSFQVLEFEIRDNPNLTSLGIDNLIEVGDLIIKNNPSLVSLDLDTIEIIEQLGVDNNNSLENLEGLESLTSLGFILFINNNENLTSLSGLSGIEVMLATIKISNNPNLISLNGLSTSINPTTFDIIIDNNDSLESLNGLQIFQTTFLLEIINNDSLITLEGLNNLSSAESIYIINNDSLSNFNELANLTSDSIDSVDLRIEGNDNLIDISGVSGLDLSIVDGINIIGNPMLSECAIENICTYLNTSDYTDNILINNNAPQCNSIEEVIVTCSPCSIVDAILTSQAEVDAFTIDFSECEIIEGTLRISGNDIVDLSPLSTITIVGNLEIIDNASLENLDGLALFSVGTTIPGSEPIFTISGNPSLMNLDGLSPLFEINAKTFEISNNPLITNFDVFSNVVISMNHANAILEIDTNASLVTIDGFNEFIVSSGDLTISIVNNDSLLNLEGLNLFLESSLLRIEGNDSLQDLSGLDALEGLGSLEIVDNQLLEDLNELNGLSRIDNSISISNNSSLTSLQGLQDLFGFENAGGVLSITDNVNLSDISVLDFFSLFMPYEAIITGNSSLSTCDLNSFCEIIISNGEITIENNGVGCNSVEEVGLNCDPCETLGLTLSSQAEVDDFPTVYENCLDGFVNVVISGPDIVDLTPLSSFTFVAGDLRVINNEQLTNLEGLNNLSSVIILEIGNNPQLSDITAISNALSNDSSIELIIRDNPLLEMCGFDAMCDFLDTNIIEVVIENNGVGCASLEEIIENCIANSNIISGNIRFDFNNNGCDTNDYAVENILVQTTDGSETQISITDAEGNFSFIVDEGVYTTSIISESLPSAFQGTPETIESTFTGVVNEEVIIFCVEVIEVVNDIAVTLVPLQEPRPGFNARYIISYTNLGTTVESGTITMNFDDEILFYEDSSLIPFTIDTGFIEWEYDEILPFETRNIEVDFELFTPPTVEGGEILVSELEITTFLEDTDPENNVFVLEEVVVNSFDPNDKQVLQGARILEEEVGDYLDYVVRFQNTGTADAINVIVTDILSDNLNWNTLRILSSSDDYRVEITNGNEVAFIYENINLPPEEQDEEGSNGYIAFQIRSNDDLVLGDAIENTANIFFDFNAPIITNTVVTTVSLPLSLEDNILQDAITIYPNPTTDILNITFASDIQLQNIDVFSVTGKKIITTQNTSIDFSSLTRGVYFARIQTNLGTIIKKIVKK